MNASSALAHGAPPGSGRVAVAARHCQRWHCSRRRIQGLRQAPQEGAYGRPRPDDRPPSLEAVSTPLCSRGVARAEASSRMATQQAAILYTLHAHCTLVARSLHATLHATLHARENTARIGFCHMRKRKRRIINIDRFFFLKCVKSIITCVFISVQRSVQRSVQ